MSLLTINTCEIPLLLRRLPHDGEDPALERARRNLAYRRKRNLIPEDAIMETLSVLWRAKKRREAA